MRTISDALDDTLRNGGGTFDALTLEPVTSGPWAVGGSLPGIVLDASGDGYHRRLAFGNAYLDLLTSGARIIGTWIDDGRLYIDAIELIESTDDALRLAAERGELAVYHITDKRTLTVRESE
jgi:hypothetical protein